jgi:hypothetical protein
MFWWCYRVYEILYEMLAGLHNGIVSGWFMTQQWLTTTKQLCCVMNYLVVETKKKGTSQKLRAKSVLYTGISMYKSISSCTTIIWCSRVVPLMTGTGHIGLDRLHSNHAMTYLFHMRQVKCPSQEHP